MTSAGGSASLLLALEAVGEQVAALRLPLEAADADAGRRLRREIGDQLADYVLPRLRRLDAPLLAVVGGPTGAGKSTLVNTVVGRRISAAGVLRPTTRSAVLVHHPSEASAFEDRRILPGLERVTSSTADPHALQLVRSDALPPGLALLDAPDIDSVVAENRELASQLLAAADMWLFVTTAARYADAVPWDFLRTAVTRGTAVAIVLDRVPKEAVAEVRADLGSMLTEQGLGGAPLFVVAETTAYDAMLPAGDIEAIRHWLSTLASDAEARDHVVRHTLDGAVRSLAARLFELAASADMQAETAARLRRAVDTAYDEGLARVDESASDGSLLRGEVLARWQEFVGTGEFMRAVEARISRARDKVTAVVKGEPAPAAGLAEALESGVEALVIAAADEAAERAGAAWQGEPAGAALLGDDDLRRSSPELREAVGRAVRDWQGFVIDLVRTQAQGKRATARYLAFGVNGLGLMAMIVVFAHTGGLVAGEVAVAGGASALSQKILEAVLGDQAVRSLSATAHENLNDRVRALLEDERARFTRRLDAAQIDESAGPRLRDAVQDVEDSG